MGLYRVQTGADDGQGREAGLLAVPLVVYLSDLENERDCLISRLRHIDRVLVDNGRLRQETLPRRVR